MKIVDDHCRSGRADCSDPRAAGRDTALRRHPTRRASDRNPRHGRNAHLGRDVDESADTQCRIDDDAAERLAGAVGRALQHVVAEGHRLAEIAEHVVNAVARELRAPHGCRTRRPDGRRHDRSPGRRRRSSGSSVRTDRSGHSDRWHSRKAQRPHTAPRRGTLWVSCPSPILPDDLQNRLIAELFHRNIGVNPAAGQGPAIRCRRTSVAQIFPIAALAALEYVRNCSTSSMRWTYFGIL